jgi:hypothetical protein
LEVNKKGEYFQGTCNILKGKPFFSGFGLKLVLISIEFKADSTGFN